MITTLCLFAYGTPDRLSEISCWRSSILSMDRDNSRTLHGSGLRKATWPSLLTSASINPRGRNTVRTSDITAASVSTMMMTSRSPKRSTSAKSKSICCWKRGSLGVSAKMTTGRAIQFRSASTISEPSKTCVWSSCQRSTTVFSCAAAGRAISATSAMFINNFITLDIAVLASKAKGQVEMSFNKFVIPYPLPFGGPHV
jgi:hypothetical protein